jgi:hypothetical protein
MKKAFFQLILAVLAVSSCGTAKYYGGFTPEASRQDMALLGPVSTIYYLDQNDEYFFSDSLTVASETLITGLVNGMNIPVSGRIELDEEQKDETAAFMRTLIGPERRRSGYVCDSGAFGRSPRSGRIPVWTAPVRPGQDA